MQREFRISPCSLEPFIWTQAPLNPGGSGVILVNYLQGLIGINKGVAGSVGNYSDSGCAPASINQQSGGRDKLKEGFFCTREDGKVVKSLSVERLI